jgi:hypothetical protein
LERRNKTFFEYCSNIAHYELRILKSIEGHNKGIEQSSPISLLKSSRIKSDLSLLKIVSYGFSGFSIIFIGYLLLNVLNNYPPRELLHK